MQGRIIPQQQTSTFYRGSSQQTSTATDSQVGSSCDWRHHDLHSSHAIFRDELTCYHTSVFNRAKCSPLLSPPRQPHRRCCGDNDRADRTEYNCSMRLCSTYLLKSLPYVHVHTLPPSNGTICRQEREVPVLHSQVTTRINYTDIYFKGTAS